MIISDCKLSVMVKASKVRCDFFFVGLSDGNIGVNNAYLVMRPNAG